MLAQDPCIYCTSLTNEIERGFVPIKKSKNFDDETFSHSCGVSHIERIYIMSRNAKGKRRLETKSFEKNRRNLNNKLLLGRGQRNSPRYIFR